MKTARFLDRSKVTLTCAVAICAGTLTWSAKAGTDGSKVAPPNTHPYGQSLAEWLVQYDIWQLPGPQSQVFGNVLFPDPRLVSFSGSGTFLDPLIVTAHDDVTVKPGTAVFLPLLSWLSEAYQDGSHDSVLPDQWFGSFLTLTEPLVIDGQAIVTAENVTSYYIPPQYLDPPYLYPQPTSYGSIGIYSVQGWCVFCRPLAPGVHQISFSASALIPDDNGVLPYGSGFIYHISYTITVAP